MNKLALAVPLILLFGCEKPVPLYCETHSDCAEFGLDFCDVNGDYPASDGIGRTCIDDPRDAGPGDDAGPDSDASTGCAEHADCDSGICEQAGGTCVAPLAIVYVDGSAGADDVGCGNTGSPCKSMSFGVLQVVGDRHFMHVEPGTYVDDTILIEDRRVRIVAHGVELFPTADLGYVSATGAANVTIEGLVTSGVQHRCTEDASLSLQGVSVSNLDTMGVYAACSATLVEDSTIRDIDQIGISGSGVTIRRSTISGNVLGLELSGDATVEQSVISNNRYGAEYYSAGTSPGLTFRNNVVVDSGDSALTISDKAVVEHNTIMGNTVSGAAVNCTSTNPVVMVGNIIYDNSGGDTSVSLGEGCSITHSNVEGGAPGTGNIDVDPKFLTGDYQLRPESPCIDRVDSDVAVDIDGDARPLGAKSDMGADEAQ